MKISHLIKKFEQEVNKSKDEASFLMTNKSRGFAWINANEVSSKYQGIFFAEDKKIFRVIESINPFKKIDRIRNNFYNLEFTSGENKETFFIPDFLNGFVLESNSESEIFLDFKEPYENDYSNYEIEKTDFGLIVNIFYKNKEYYLAVCFKGDFKESKEWIYRNYSYDRKRNSFPNERSVFFLGKINSEKIVFYFSGNKEDAVKKSKDLYENLKEYKREKRERIESVFNKISEERVNIAYNSCRLSLDNLNDKEGIFAGLPWFFQYWARDELISLKGLYSVSKKHTKQILKKWIKHLGNEMEKFPAKLRIDDSEEGNSIDSVGWLLKRTELFPELLQENKTILDEFFINLDEELINEKNNSWMDSIQRDSGIEIQAMKLFALKLASKLTNKKEEFRKKEKALKKKIKEIYWNGNVLFDSLDKKIRPNVFIAYYFYPELFEKKEWETCFDNLIKNLWCEWGGFSTIGKEDSLFHKDYTGETGGSYHNGDSWFWINNLAGIVLFDLNKEKYYSYIKKILNASTEEILFSGAIANHSELSSASSLKSEGAICQAFSAGMYIELIEKIMKG